MQFFLSRATGNDDIYALRFHRDLSARVAAKSGTQGAVSFVDAVPRTDTVAWSHHERASPWTPAAWDAITSCQAFVALCSPRYFLSARCGQEWWLFTERLRRDERRSEMQPAQMIFPVLWSGSGPDPLETVRHLARLSSLRQTYETYVDDLADRIVAAFRSSPVPALTPEPDPTAVPNAFDLADPGPGTLPFPALRNPASASARRVHIVVAAGNRSEMTKVRTDLQFYGDRREDWAPYRPSLPESIATHAQRISASRFLDSDVTEVSQLTDRVDHARENNELVVLLVDSWITKLADHRSALATMDSRDEPALAILAPVSETDRETSRHRGELRSGLRSVLRRSLARKDQRLRIEIDDTRSFEIDLVTALEEAQNRIFQHGRIFRAPVARAPFGRPILQGP